MPQLEKVVLLGHLCRCAFEEGWELGDAVGRNCSFQPPLDSDSFYQNRSSAEDKPSHAGNA